MLGYGKSNFEDTERGDIHQRIYLVLEYCPGRELFDHAIMEGQKPFNEIMSRHFLKQLIDAVEFLHSQELAHMDIKM